MTHLLKVCIRRVLTIGIIAFTLISCSVPRQISAHQREYTQLLERFEERTIRSEKQIRVYKDSLETVKGLMERSSNLSDSLSHLETSYARSDATLRNGKLYHSIENKDSIPAPTRYFYLENVRHDTLETSKIDTLYREAVRTVETVTTSKRFGNTFFYTSGWIAWIILAGISIRLLYHFKKNKR